VFSRRAWFLITCCLLDRLQEIDSILYDSQHIGSEHKPVEPVSQQQLESPVLANQQLGEVASAVWNALPGSHAVAPSNVSVSAPKALVVKPRQRRPEVDRSSVDSTAVAGVWPSLHCFAVRWMQQSVFIGRVVQAT
jgi:hypothetical protein